MRGDRKGKSLSKSLHCYMVLSSGNGFTCHQLELEGREEEQAPRTSARYVLFLRRKGEHGKTFKGRRKGVAKSALIGRDRSRGGFDFHVLREGDG